MTVGQGAAEECILDDEFASSEAEKNHVKKRGCTNQGVRFEPLDGRPEERRLVRQAPRILPESVRDEGGC